MSEGVQRVRSLVEIRAVAVHQRLLVAEDHITPQYLRIGDTLLVKTQILRPLQIDHRLGMARQGHDRQNHDMY